MATVTYEQVKLFIQDQKLLKQKYPAPQEVAARFEITIELATRLLERYMGEVEKPAQLRREEKIPALTEEEAIEVIRKYDDEDVSQDEIVQDLVDINKYREEDHDIEPVLSSDQLRALVKKYAKNALEKVEAKPEAVPEVVSPVASALSAPATYPVELEPLVVSGVAKFAYDVWLVSRCGKCGQFKNECCGEVGNVCAVRHDKTFTHYGKQAMGLIPIDPPKPPKTIEEIRKQQMMALKDEPWWNDFSSVDELEGDGMVKMYIENFLPEGVTLICGLWKEGKSFLAMSIAKALTTGQPLFGRVGYEVPEAVPVLYLAAETGDNQLKLRCKKFNITTDKTMFIARSLSKGQMLDLGDIKIEGLVKKMRPVVVLETLIRFNEGDEDDAAQSKKVTDDILQLLSWGARAVIVLHHSRKDFDRNNPTLEALSRGSGNILSMADVVWGIIRDNKLYKHDTGPNEVTLLAMGQRDVHPAPIRLALTETAPKDLPSGTITYAPGLVSCIDQLGDFKWVDRAERVEQAQAEQKSLDQVVAQLIAENPTLTLAGLVEKSEAKTNWEVRKALKRLGYRRPTGGKKGGSGEWIKAAA